MFFSSCAAKTVFKIIKMNNNNYSFSLNLNILNDLQFCYKLTYFHHIVGIDPSVAHLLKLYTLIFFSKVKTK